MDSVAFDLHKWFYLPIDIGCVLVRDPDALRHPFTHAPADYLQAFERGLGAGEHRYSDRGPELTRPFRALKAWMCLRAYDVERYGRLIAQNVGQARRLRDRVEATPELELLAPVPLNIVCFRYRGTGSGAGGDDLDALNRGLLMRLWESGVAAPSGTVIDGTFAIRCAFTNHRTRADDPELMVERALAIGDELAGRQQRRVAPLGGETARTCPASERPRAGARRVGRREGLRRRTQGDLEPT